MAQAADFAARVRTAFPALAFSEAVLAQKGEDHHVLMLDGRYVFRFPRHADHPTGLALERAVLAALKGRCEVAVPDYRYVAPDGAFAGYKMIAGDELTPTRFARLSRQTQERVLDQIADFVSAMHGLTVCEIEAAAGATFDWPREISPADYAADGRERRLPPIARAFPHLVPLVEAFYTRFERRPAGPERVLHGDVSHDHLLLAPSADRLGGVIDFGDAELGDPMHDVCYLWSYGDWASGGCLSAIPSRMRTPTCWSAPDGDTAATGFHAWARRSIAAGPRSPPMARRNCRAYWRRSSGSSLDASESHNPLIPANAGMSGFSGTN